MCSFNLFVVLLLLTFFTTQCSVARSVDFHVGVILDLDSVDSPVGRIGMRSLSMALSDFYSFHEDYKTRLILHPIDSNGSIVDAASAALYLLRDVKVDAIIGPQKSTQADFVMNLGDRAHVPILSFSATTPSLINRTPYFVQTAQSDANQVQAIASIIKEFLWTQIVIIYEDSELGNDIIPYLSNALQDIHASVTYRSVLPRSAADDILSDELHKIMSMQTRVFVLHTSQFLGTRLFLKARELGMMTEGYAWIVTSGLTDLFRSISSDVAESMQGVVGVRPLVPKSEQLHSYVSRWRMFYQDNHDMKLAETSSIFGLWAYDTLWALGMAAERVGVSRLSATEDEDNANFTSPFTIGVSETGPKLLKVLSDTRFTGIAGEFNLVNRQLALTAYEIVNVVESIERPVGIWTPTGGISRKLNLNGTIPYSSSKANFRTIIWPGDSIKAPRGWEYPNKGEKLRIAVPQKPGFNDFLKWEVDPQTNEATVTGYYRDIFDAAMYALPYSIPYKFVPYPFRSYDDLVYQVSMQNGYDGALGDITITANRSNYADFTMPYAEGGVACIVPIKYEDVNDVLTFIQPLTTQLWLTAAVFYISTALVIWILAKRLAHSLRDSLVQHAGMSCLFPFFTGERIEVSLICLILLAWAVVGNLLDSTYTASLSSRLTIARLIPTVTNVKELIENGEYVGCQDGSFLKNFLVRKGFAESKIKNYTSVDACKNDLFLGSKGNGISAYCDVMPHIRLILSEACGKYMIINPIYRTDGFAFAFPKGFPAVADISRAIVQLTENGIIREIEEKLECLVPDGNSSPTRVPLQSFSVLFSIAGFVTLACLLVSLLIHLHKKRPLPLRITEFKATSCSTILAFRHYLRKRKDRSSLPATTNAGEDVPQVEEMASSNDHVIEIEVIPLDHLS